jgi:hypothetical protein
MPNCNLILWQWLALVWLLVCAVQVQQARHWVVALRGQLRYAVGNRHAQLRSVNMVLRRASLLADLPFMPKPLRMGLQLSQWLAKR